MPHEGNEGNNEIAAVFSIVETLGHGMAVIDPEFRLLRHNDIYSGFSRSRVGDFCYQVFANRDRACEKCPAVDTFGTGAISTAAVELATGNFQVVSYPVRNGFREVTAAMMIVRDITLAARMEELIPICSSCRKVRDDLGAWSRIEDFFNKKLEMKFTHSLCPECEEYHYPEATEESLRLFATMKSALLQLEKNREEMQQEPLDDAKFRRFMASYGSYVELNEKWWAKIRKTSPR